MKSKLANQKGWYITLHLLHERLDTIVSIVCHVHLACTTHSVGHSLEDLLLKLALCGRLKHHNTLISSINELQLSADVIQMSSLRDVDSEIHAFSWVLSIYLK
jgi:hypothetical protein